MGEKVSERGERGKRQEGVSDPRYVRTTLNIHILDIDTFQNLYIFWNINTYREASEKANMYSKCMQNDMDRVYSN